jgi:hypothetical protein
MRSQPEVGRIFAFQLKSDRFLHVLHQFVERQCLRHDRQVEALRHEVLVPTKDANVNDSLHCSNDSQVAHHQAMAFSTVFGWQRLCRLCRALDQRRSVQDFGFAAAGVSGGGTSDGLTQFTLNGPAP